MPGVAPQARDLLELALPKVRDHAIVLLDPQGIIVAWLCGAEDQRDDPEPGAGRHEETEALISGLLQGGAGVCGELQVMRAGGSRFRLDFRGNGWFWPETDVDVMSGSEG